MLQLPPLELENQRNEDGITEAQKPGGRACGAETWISEKGALLMSVPQELWGQFSRDGTQPLGKVPVSRLGVLRENAKAGSRSIEKAAKWNQRLLLEQTASV